ncbi:ParA family protein [Vibrio parahaemolyticus]|uniref:ParA family protein n=1 Tax=Vibrio parahaemolyticus TaxID=670 RepID=UPI00387ACE17|nr:ParA family protein [Vibrio parahaemolyticus]MDF4686899.1 ParA family protein [Vibrio parahaemolyticus]HCZ9711834.1 ParA family protein [Vibrio parahaemolyticus]
MAKIIALLNQKGGVGKTTTAINLSDTFSNQGYKVLGIDLDPQGNFSKVVSNGEVRFEKNVMNLFLKDNTTNIEDLILDSEGNENFSYIPTDIRLSRVIESGLTLSFREHRLSKHLDKIKSQFDFIILDCPPNLSLTTTNAIVAADLFLMPVNSGVFALDGLEDLLAALHEVGQGEELPYYVFRNEVATQNKKINTAIDEDLVSIASDRVLNSSIRRCEDIGQASFMSLPLSKYKKGSVAINDYKALAREVKKLL